MIQPTLKEVEQFVRDLVLPFDAIERDIQLPIKPRRAETDAEHSWSLAFVACALAPTIDSNLDLGTLAQLAIAHDVVEVFAGDVSVWDADNLSDKVEREAQALLQIQKRFAHLPWIASTIETYERLDTPEAQFVYALDKFLPLLIRHIDRGQGYIDKKLTLQEFTKGLGPSRTKAQAHPVIGRYFEELWQIFAASPDYFYQEKSE